MRSTAVASKEPARKADHAPTSSAEPQRAHVGDGAWSALATASAAPLALQRAPGAAAPGAAAGGSAQGATPPIVEDESSEVSPGQARKSEFLDRVQRAVCSALEPVLAEAGQSTRGCLYLAMLFPRLRRKSSEELNEIARQYGERFASADELLAEIVSRAIESARVWVERGELSGVPDIARLDEAGSGVEIGLLQAKRGAGDAGPGASDPRSIRAALGPGQPLAGTERGRMEAAFGESLAHVRVHRHAAADRLARRERALAFTVGSHIAFSSDAEAPGTPRGDALLAHELAHTRQQREARVERRPLERSSYRSLEREADGVAGQVLRRLYSESERGTPEILPATRRGLSLQRCDPCKGERPSPTTTTLPPARSGTKVLAQGTMRWTLAPAGQSSLNARIEFEPNAATRATARTISFIQTVRATRQGDPILPSDPAGDMGGGAEYGGPRYVRVDFTASHESEPFYGARWDPAASGGGAFTDEPGATQASHLGGSGEGSRPASTSSTSAVLNDTPTVQTFQGEKKEFETVAVVAETGRVLGSLRWGFEYKCQGPNAYQLLGGQVADCTEGATAEFRPAVERFFAARFDAMLDGFAPGGSSLTPAHQSALDRVVSRLNAEPNKVVLLGGAADLSEADPVTVSRQRAEAAKAYLMGRGIAENRIQIHTYGSAYARVETTARAAEPRNRRVQVWVRNP